MPSAKKQMHLRTCMACGKVHETHKPKAARCQPCIDAGRPAKTRTCPACDEKYPAIHGGNFCGSCAANPKALEDDDAKAKAEFEAKLINMIEVEKEERRLKAKEKRREQAQRQLDALNELSKTPKGLPKMTKETAESAIGILWLNLCHSDGSVTTLLRDQTADDETKGRLLMAHMRLRLKGYTNEAVTTVDPVKLIKQDPEQIDKALTEMPGVEANPDANDWSFDPLEGLEPDMRDEVIAFQERQNQREMEQRLGLA